jgi:hypothetical protein
MNEFRYRSLANGMRRPRRHHVPGKNHRITLRPHTIGSRAFNDDLTSYNRGHSFKAVDLKDRNVLTSHRDRQIIYL